MAERPEDLNLPNAVITRIIKDALPEGVNVSKEARSAISRAASVFVLYATSCANNFAVKSKRKTLSGNDVLSAVEEMEFQQLLAPLRESLDAYRRDLKGRKEASEQRRKDKETPRRDAGDEGDTGPADGSVGDEPATDEAAADEGAAEEAAADEAAADEGD
uniref:DNA polymerase epsilon subunit 3 n=1 Tax=Petromyzon marinus TaxID=7757 RepID=A0AAJ7U9L5_PETMA|nr:DNA polymerase epsilon subunit 3 [Petromyzon marinus]XP_032832197.1 DNA polymerase epsilon subunit 3 [Petromyzon marinus]